MLEWLLPPTGRPLAIDEDGGVSVAGQVETAASWVVPMPS
jgi:hypothetical protein